MARHRGIPAPDRQLSFLPSEGLEKEPVLDAPPQAGRARHPYNAAFGDRTPDAIQSLRATLTVSGHTIGVTTLAGYVLSDWDEYCIAVEDSLPMTVAEYAGDDPEAFACLRAFHGLNLNKRQRALRVVRMFPWAERGRPKKPVESTGFSSDDLTPRTATQMAELANCSEETIRQARRIASSGLLECVMDRQCTFSNALRIIKGMGGAGVTDGASSEAATSLEVPSTTQEDESENAVAGNNEATGADSQRRHAKGVDELTLENDRLVEQVRTLTRENVRLKEEVTELRSRPTTAPPAEAGAAHLRGQITHLEVRLHSQEEGTRREKSRADAAEREVARLRHQLQQAA